MICVIKTKHQLSKLPVKIMQPLISHTLIASSQVYLIIRWQILYKLWKVSRIGNFSTQLQYCVMYSWKMTLFCEGADLQNKQKKLLQIPNQNWPEQHSNRARSSVVVQNRNSENSNSIYPRWDAAVGSAIMCFMDLMQKWPNWCGCVAQREWKKWKASV